MAGEPGPGGRRHAVQPAHRGARLPRPPPAERRRCRSTRPRFAEALALLARPQAAGSASTPAWAAWTTRDALVAARRAAAGPGGDQRLRQGRDSRSATRWPSAGATGRRPRARRAGLRQSNPFEPASICCWPSACSSARCRPASTPTRRPSTSIHVDANPCNLGKVLQGRRRASTPTPACSCRSCWPTPAMHAPAAGRQADRPASSSRRPTTPRGTRRSTPAVRRRPDGVRAGPAPQPAGRRPGVRRRDA